MILSRIISIFEGIAPPEYAMPDDRIGLQVGDPDQDVRRIIVTLDVTDFIVREADRQSADLVVAHHPLIYNPLTNLRTDAYPQSLVCSLMKSETALYVMHTNFDAADGGVNDALADRLGLVDREVLEPTYSEKLFKLIVFVPEESADSVRDALGDLGAGSMGNYSHCSFRSKGKGTFTPMPGAEPYIGEVGELETVSEVRLEVLVPKTMLHEAISTMIRVHPYESPAYDIIPLENSGGTWGLGRVGRLTSRMTFEGFCEMVRDVLDVEDTRVMGDPESPVERVALLGGGGGNRIELAYSKGVDVYLTGDVNHHQFLQAQALGLNVIDATHYRTECPGMIALTPRLQDLLSSEGVVVEYVDSLGSNG